MLEIGEVLAGRYEILQKIGTGGMAVVYRAKDRKLNRDVAIKVLKEEFSRDKQFVSKFREEAQAAAGLSHANIVSVYDVGESGSIYYIVMELIEGITLKEYILRKHRLDTRETIGVAIQVASGLGAAHARHLIHRDIKPQNIMISRDGKIKVTDFGIARAITDETTNMYRAAGSVHYISPEQAKGGYCDERSDIYSLGITMYEMATGKLPFDGDTTVAVAIAQMNQDPVPPSQIVPTIPPALEDIILKCIQKNPDMRYSNCAELISDLRQTIVTPQKHFVRFGSEAKLPAGGTAGAAAAAAASGTGAAEASASGAYHVPQATIMMNNIKWRGQGNSAQSSAQQPSPFARPAAGREAAGAAAEGRAREENAGQGAAGRYRGETAGGQRRMQAAGSRRNPSADERRQERAAGRASDGNRRRAASAASAAAKTTPPEDLPATMFDHVLTVIGGTLGVVILIMVIYIGISVNGFLRPSTSAASVGTAAQTTTAAAAETEAATEDTAEETETSEDMTEVPNLLGMTITEAREALESAGLVYRFTNSYESSDIYEAGLVCKQQYEPGTLVKKNTTVKISISMGTDKVVLKGEDYIGVNLTVLEYLLNGTDIDVEYIATESDEPKNTILSIEPLDATLSPGDKLTVYYSKGPSTVAVSSLIGLTQDQAASRLSDQGLTLGNVTQEYNSSVEANLVCAQSISEGTVVKIGSSVDITISLGPKMIQIPSVIGMSEADATTTLQNSELSVTSAYENSSSAAGTVIRQSPEAGGWANQWSTVTIVVSTGPAQVTVPSVTGMTQDQAASTLASAGLSVTWTEANNDSVEAGIVTYQSVDAGTTVDAGTVISCEVSLGPAATTTTGATTAAQTTVPSVTGTQQADAEAALTAAGLTVTEWRMVSYDDVPAGTVTYQSLEAGTTVAVGSTLYCEVSSGPASQ